MTCLGGLVDSFHTQTESLLNTKQMYRKKKEKQHQQYNNMQIYTRLLLAAMT